jgi:Bacteriocin-protection, YdeI or OmpD-Associated/Domain of unknown function (DUF1905)
VDDHPEDISAFHRNGRGRGPGRVLVPLPFAADEAWGAKPTHRLGGSVNGIRVRATVERSADGEVFALGPAWRQGRDITVGDAVTVELAPEGPQRADLADDIAAALDADPAAGAFFDGLAQFYRKAYLRWVEATKRKPEQRAQRIQEMVACLAAGLKQRLD